MSDKMQAKKLFTVALALACVMSFAFIFEADSSDAADSTVKVVKTKDPTWGGFTDMKDGNFTVYLMSNMTDEVTVKVVVFDTESGKEKDRTEAVLKPSEETSVRTGFGYGSDGTKMVYYKVLDVEDKEIFTDGSFEISVSHSLWKNTSTYVAVVIIVIIVVIVVVVIMRSRTKKVVGGGKSFTELEAERKAKRTNKVAERRTYKAGEKKTRK